jgi:hypothetical protein
MNPFESIQQELLKLLKIWEPKLQTLQEEIIAGRRNGQNRTIRQILGHLIDSASNNTHRMIHLQYQASPMKFPNYASYGNNDRWIAIQHYQQEDWNAMIQLWKYTNLHLTHVIQYIDTSKLDNQWYYDENKLISLQEGIVDYLRHFKLHLAEIDELIHENK